MKFFKKPVVAVLMSIVIVIASTFLSVNIKLGKECQQITDGFYDGVYSNGYTQKSLSTHLRNLCGYADGIVTIANNYDLDTTAVRQASDDLKLGLSYSYGQASYLYQCYEQLLSSAKELEDSLGRTELGDRDKEGLEQYESSITGVENAVQSAGYNESVREFLRDYIKFPADFFVGLTGIDLPEQFA